MPDSPAVLLQKTYACMALALAGRGCEAYNVLVGDVSRVTDDEGNASFHVAFDRSKNLRPLPGSHHWPLGGAHDQRLPRSAPCRRAGTGGEGEEVLPQDRQAHRSWQTKDVLGRPERGQGDAGQHWQRGKHRHYSAIHVTNTYANMYTYLPLRWRRPWAWRTGSSSRDTAGAGTR
jgi:hypothetical protein